MITINIKTLNNDFVFTLSAKQTDTIHTIKYLYFNIFCINDNLHELMDYSKCKFNNIELENDKSLEYYNIQYDDTIHFVKKQRYINDKLYCNYDLNETSIVESFTHLCEISDKDMLISENTNTMYVIKHNLDNEFKTIKSKYIIEWIDLAYYVLKKQPLFDNHYFFYK